MQRLAWVDLQVDDRVVWVVELAQDAAVRSQRRDDLLGLRDGALHALVPRGQHQLGACSYNERR